MRNKRQLTIYAIIVAIILGATPYFTGMLVKRKFEQIAQVFTEIDPIRIQIVDYQQGWRTSKAKTQVTFKGSQLQQALHQANPIADFSIILDHDIRHGPFVQLKDGNYQDWRFALATIQSKISLTDSAKQALVEQLGDSQLFNINSEITIDGAYNAIIQGKPIKVKTPSGQEVEVWRGIHGDVHLNRNLDQLQTQMIIPGFDFEYQGMHYKASDLVIKTQRNKTPEGLWIGKANATLQSMSFQDPANQSAVSMRAFTMGNLMEIQNNLLRSSLSFTVEEVKVDRDQYGPLNAVFTVRNISPTIAKRFMDILQSIQMSGNYQTHFSDLLAILPEFMQHRPEVNLEEFSVHTPNGELKSTMKFAMGGPNVVNVEQMLRSIDANIHLEISQTLLKAFLTSEAATIDYVREAQSKNPNFIVPDLNDPELAKLVAQNADAFIAKQIQDGWLIAKDLFYVMDFKMLNGESTVNGKSDMPLAAFPLQKVRFH